MYPALHSNGYILLGEEGGVVSVGSISEPRVNPPNSRSHDEVGNKRFRMDFEI